MRKKNDLKIFTVSVYASQSRDILQKFVWWGARICFLLKRLQQLATFWSYIYVSFQHITFKISIFTNSKAFFLSRVGGSKSKV